MLAENPEDIATGDNLTLSDLHPIMGNSKFCFVPRGKSGWSLRLFESVFAGCVPVMLSDLWELPFEDWLDTSRFVIKWPTTRINTELLDYLRSLPDEVVRGYQEAAEEARCWWLHKKLNNFSFSGLECHVSIQNLS